MKLDIDVIGFVLGVVLVLGCGGRLGRTPVGPNHAANLMAQRARAVIVSTPCGSGSGVAVGPHHVLSAAHVATCLTGDITIKAGDGKVRDAVVEIVSLEADLVRLRIVGEDLPFHPLETAPVEDGMHVCIVSTQPDAGRRCGRVREIRPYGPGNVSHTAFTLAGNSGSGVYDGRGRLVGIATHRRSNVDGSPNGGLFSSIYKRFDMI